MDKSNYDEQTFFVGELLFVRDNLMASFAPKCECEDDCGEWCGTNGD